MNPNKRAFDREYRRAWLRTAWASTRRAEKRRGIWISLALTILVALIDWLIVGRGVNVAALSLSALIAFGFVLLLLFVWPLVATPSNLSYEGVRPADISPMDSEPYKRVIDPPNGYGPKTVAFVTANKPHRLIKAGYPAGAIRFLKPKEQVVRREDLPAEFRMGWWRGRIIVKEFYPTGFWIAEKGTAGRLVHVEIYTPEDAP